MFRKLIPSLVLLALVLSLFATYQPVAAVGEIPGLFLEFYASPKVERTWNWTINKTANFSSLLLSPGQSQLVSYTVALAAAPTDYNLRIQGVVKATNNTGAPVAVNSLLITPPAGGKVLTCSLPTTLAVGQTVECFFTYPAAEITTDPHVITATLSTSLGTVTGSKSVPLSPVTVLAEFDKCVNVTDSAFGALGQVCATDAQKTFTFNYTKTFQYEACGEYDFPNTASFVSTQTSTKTGSSTWNVHTSVPCAGGCSLTPGYWKTHSQYGPAPYDSTWASLGENTTFFSSGQSYYNVLWTAPKGNAYYILAHAYIAAVLNGLNGADTSAVSAQLAYANNFFSTYGPGDAMSKALRAEVTAAASTIDSYNNGYIGPGHCTE